MEYGLIGGKLGHSYSPMIHARLGGYRYELKECTPEQVAALMTSRDFKGLNVTIPYKKTVMPYCDELSETAREIGCVNTLVIRPDGTLYGHNTDIGGFTCMLKKAGIDPAGKKCCILGSGATSLTAATALRHMGAKEIVTISRSGENDYASLHTRHADCEILVNCSPAGMYPNNGTCLADVTKLTKLKGVADVVYNPERTKLILDAEAMGIRCVSGLDMLVAQAREAAELFAGKPIPPEADDAITADILGQTLNLVLVGMPGSGKTSIGLGAAERMGRPIVHCDELIERRAGMTIPEIFEKYGEAYFRDLESEVMEDVCRAPGQVISCGGGVILRERNVRAMRQNGRICLILRDISKLPRDGRPLSSSEEAVARLWETRKERYYACADYTVDNTGTLEDGVKAAVEGFYETAHH